MPRGGESIPPPRICELSGLGNPESGLAPLVPVFVNGTGAGEFICGDWQPAPEPKSRGARCASEPLGG